VLALCISSLLFKRSKQHLSVAGNPGARAPRPRRRQRVLAGARGGAHASGATHLRNGSSSTRAQAVKDFYADFAADLDAQMFFPMRGDEDPFRRFSVELKKVIDELIRFGRLAMDLYFLDREQLIIVEEIAGPRSPWPSAEA